MPLVKTEPGDALLLEVRSENSEMDVLIKTIIEKTAVNRILEEIHYRDLAEAGK